jgi:hypothetical protein
MHRPAVPTMRRTLATAATTILLVGMLCTVATAQAGAAGRGRDKPFMAIAHRDLSFGEVLPGIPESVTSSDPRHAGLFEIQGTPGAAVRVEFLLPPAMATPFGATLPLEFGAGDGYADFGRGHPPRGLQFDPRTPLTAALGPNGRLLVSLGGTVEPARNQAGGAYAAAISITVYDLGI